MLVKKKSGNHGRIVKKSEQAVKGNSMDIKYGCPRKDA